jgi:transcriptional regulator with XRE-family HTH domain
MVKGNETAQNEKKKIIDLRQAKDMTQAELATAAGLTTTVVYRMEHNIRVNRNSVRLVCAVLGVDIAEVDVKLRQRVKRV